MAALAVRDTFAELFYGKLLSLDPPLARLFTAFGPPYERLARAMQI